MGLFDFLKPSAPAPEPAPAVEPRAIVAAPARPSVNQSALNRAGLRIGMWVKTADGVGILTASHADGSMGVTLVKEDGATKMTLSDDDKAVPHVLTLDPAAIAQASADDIPAARRPHPDTLHALGYGVAA